MSYFDNFSESGVIIRLVGALLAIGVLFGLDPTLATIVLFGFAIVYFIERQTGFLSNFYDRHNPETYRREMAAYEARQKPMGGQGSMMRNKMKKEQETSTEN